MESRGRIHFEDFQLDLAAFELTCSGEAIALEPQALTLLVHLYSNRERVVSKDELLDEIWGHRYVSESALATQVKAVRKAVGDDGRSQRVIKTLRGHGYRFVAEVTVQEAPENVGVPRAGRENDTNLGTNRMPLFGREQELRRCIEMLAGHRMVSLLGVGGTGKTRLAKAVGLAELARYPDGVWFVDLVPVSESAGIDTAVADAMGLAIQGASIREEVIRAIMARRTLIILDNCEHIENDVASFMDQVLELTAEPRFLITSRDPIDLADEARFFVTPLPVGQEGEDAPAVQLFNATALRHGTPDVGDPATIRSICKALDGLPLAIELAAAQLRYLTLDELATRLDRRFEVLVGRQRVGGARQESLLAIVEDTWQLLGADEQNLLLQIASFAGPFTVEDIEGLVDGDFAGGMAFALSRLVELCLLNRTSQAGGWWQLLETVRAFALGKMDDEAKDTASRRHAQWVKRRLGDYPHDHLDDFGQAEWARAHYADLLAAEQYLAVSGDFENAVFVCCAVGLMIQVDEGARALEKLERIDGYLKHAHDAACGVQLHGMASLCAQVIRDRDRLVHHAGESLAMSRELGEPNRLAGALILASLTVSFSEAKIALEEAVERAESIGDRLSADSVTSFYAWHLGVRGELAQAREIALEIAQRRFERDNLDNPTYNAVCAVIACSIFEQPSLAIQWMQTLTDSPIAHSLWGAQLLIACAHSINDEPVKAAEICLEVKDRLEQAGRQPWPDLLVPAVLLAHKAGEGERAQRWLNAVKRAGQPLQTFHVITVYLQLREVVGVAEGDGSEQVAEDELGAEVWAWFAAVVAGE